MSDKVTVRQFKDSLVRLMRSADEVKACIDALEQNEIFKSYEMSVTNKKVTLSNLVTKWIEQSEHVMKMFNDLMDRADKRSK